MKIRKNKTVYDSRHYLAVVQRKPGALRNGTMSTDAMMTTLKSFNVMLQNIMIFLRDSILCTCNWKSEHMIDMCSLCYLHKQSIYSQRYTCAIWQSGTDCS